MGLVVKSSATRQPPVGGNGYIIQLASDWMAPLPRGTYTDPAQWADAHERRHAGIDLKLAKDVPITSPEDGQVYAVLKRGFKYGEEPSPFTRYGPEAIAIKGSSGVYHFITHLKGLYPTYVGNEVRKNQPLAFNVDSGGLNHTHWEVRNQPYATSRGRGQWLITMDPVKWIAGDMQSGAQAESLLKEGNPLRAPGSYPITLEAPMVIQPAIVTPTAIPTAPVVPEAKTGGGLMILGLLALGGYAWHKKKSR